LGPGLSPVLAIFQACNPFSLTLPIFNRHSSSSWSIFAVSDLFYPFSKLAGAPGPPPSLLFMNSGRAPPWARFPKGNWSLPLWKSPLSAFLRHFDVGPRTFSFLFRFFCCLGLYENFCSEALSRATSSCFPHDQRTTIPHQRALSPSIASMFMVLVPSFTLVPDRDCRCRFPLPFFLRRLFGFHE